MPQAGQGRRLYPVFVQLSAFMSMNPEWHKKNFRTCTDTSSRTRSKRPKPFAFQTYDLGKGKLVCRGCTVDCGANRRTALMTVEGERGAICSVG